MPRSAAGRPGTLPGSRPCATTWASRRTSLPSSSARASKRSPNGRPASTGRAASPSAFSAWWPNVRASPTRRNRRARTAPDVVALRVAEPRVFYQPRSPSWLGLAEPAADPLTEAELSWIWAGQRFPPEALQAVDGRPLRILNPGRPGGGAGPDYLDAVFELGGEQRRGDIELHVRASSWYGHGHATDPAYD